MYRQLSFQNEFLGPTALRNVSEMGVSTKGISAEVITRWELQLFGRCQVKGLPAKDCAF